MHIFSIISNFQSTLSKLLRILSEPDQLKTWLNGTAEVDQLCIFRNQLVLLKPKLVSISHENQKIHDTGLFYLQKRARFVSLVRLFFNKFCFQAIFSCATHSPAF